MENPFKRECTYYLRGGMLSARMEELIHPRRCRIMPGNAQQRSDLRFTYLIVAPSRGDRLHLAQQPWLLAHDHLIIAEEEVQQEDLAVGMRWGSVRAHRALAGVLCAHAITSGRWKTLHDWTLVVDDDTVVDVALLDELLQSARPRAVPVMLGALVHKQLNGSLDVQCAAPRPRPEGVEMKGAWRIHWWQSSFDGRPCPRAKVMRDGEPASASREEPVDEPWAFEVVGTPGAPSAQRGAWAVGWPHGGLGIVISRAGVEELAVVGADCLRCLTCPWYGGGTATKAAISLMVRNKTKQPLPPPTADAALGFGTCGRHMYAGAHAFVGSLGTGKCAGSFNGYYANYELADVGASTRRTAAAGGGARSPLEKPLFIRETHCSALGMRCADTDVQLGYCFGRAGFAPQRLPGPWSAHLKALRSDERALAAAASRFLNGSTRRDDLSWAARSGSSPAADLLGPSLVLNVN